MSKDVTRFHCTLLTNEITECIPAVQEQGESSPLTEFQLLLKIPITQQ